eukprot:TRINITY_DN42213_c0_g2_i1.p1 TRINITY_DN42213_c0_g2~~TRINITY_DN42213_c0_g2_i1.p1  ORF type:complete len:1012 (-),score=155.89 TRINITY_DN42213_c0_g2_i1:314-3349(-)
MESSSPAKAAYFAKLAEIAEDDDMVTCMREVAAVSGDSSLADGLLQSALGPYVTRANTCRSTERSGAEEENYREVAAGKNGGPRLEVTEDVSTNGMSGADSNHSSAADDSEQEEKVTKNEARIAYRDALRAARSRLPSVHPTYFELSLTLSVFNSEVLNSPVQACLSAPRPLRYAAPKALPSGRPACKADVSHRLYDLLLEFPVAAVAGVRWSVLSRAYEEVYGESVDYDRFGFVSAREAARGLLPKGVFRDEQGHGAVDGEAVVDPTAVVDPAVAIRDAVALTPLPGFASSWPSLYTTLLAVVQSYGALESAPEEQGEGSKQETEAGSAVQSPCEVRMLILSKIRPLLDKVEEGAADTVSVIDATAIETMRSLLISQLQPVAHLSHVTNNENGLSFRDEEGVFKRLHKIGHVVKAVLSWRDQRIRWQQANMHVRTRVDEALVPKLELSFAKQYNNLVLRHIGNCQNCAEGADIEATQPAASTASGSGHSNNVDNVQTEKLHKEFKGYDNPFKWAAATEAERQRPSPAPPLPARRDVARSSASKMCSAGETQRGRSVSRAPPGLDEPEGSGKRSKSEPQQQLADELFDDPFEPPPQRDRWASPPRTWSQAGGHRRSGSEPSAHGGNSVGGDSHHHVGSPMRQPPVQPFVLVFPGATSDTSKFMGLPRAQQRRCGSPMRMGSSIATTRVPSRDRVKMRRNSRARSLTKASPGLVRPPPGLTRSGTPPMEEENRGTRCKSEPPRPPCAEAEEDDDFVFDDPFEPPPQSGWWGPGLGVGQPGSATPRAFVASACQVFGHNAFGGISRRSSTPSRHGGGGSSMATTRAPSWEREAACGFNVGARRVGGSYLGRTPKKVGGGDVTSSGRARSLTKSSTGGGPVRDNAATSSEQLDDGQIGTRSQSEPRQFDDPFEPPPQYLWWAPPLLPWFNSFGPLVTPVGFPNSPGTEEKSSGFTCQEAANGAETVGTSNVSLGTIMFMYNCLELNVNSQPPASIGSCDYGVRESTDACRATPE